MKTSMHGWMLVTVLLLLVTPLAAAQTASGSLIPGLSPSLWYFLVNSIIIFAIMFLPVSKIVPGKGFEKALGYIIALGVAGVTSWFFVGGGGYIWQTGIFAPYLTAVGLVNLAVVFGVIYAILKLAKVDLISGDSKWVGYILIFLFTAVITRRMEDFIWNYPVIKIVLGIYFGPDGIFVSADRLLTFVSLFIIFTMFFREALGMKEDSKILTYGLPLLLATHLARDGISNTLLLSLGELLVIYLLSRKGEGARGILGTVLVCVFVLWIDVAIFNSNGLTRYIFGDGASGSSALSLTGDALINLAVGALIVGGIVFLGLSLFGIFTTNFLGPLIWIGILVGGYFIWVNFISPRLPIFLLIPPAHLLGDMKLWWSETKKWYRLHLRSLLIGERSKKETEEKKEHG